jgi:glycosyltransferase involved in cell wall biosynthesis
MVDCFPTAPLVIVISAFKYQYLEQTLFSLAVQSNPNFLVFVGDDAGSPKIAEICADFTEKLQIKYYRFESNLGGQSLVQQWERCIAMTQAPWIMLLGDDDMLDTECVQCFYDHLFSDQIHKNCNVFRFNTRIIDKSNNVIRENPIHEEFVTTADFLTKRFLGSSSYVVEFIFARKIYESLGGFKEFPLAWCSDDATWTKFSICGGIVCLGGPKVSWRLSGDNISSFNPKLSMIKIRTNMDYLMWLKDNIFGLIISDKRGLRIIKKNASTWFLRSIFDSKAYISPAFFLFYALSYFYLMDEARCVAALI